MWGGFLTAFFTDLLSYLNKLNLKLQGRNQFLDEIWGHLRAFKMQLMRFSNQVSKNDLSHFLKLQSIASLNEEKIISYEASLGKLHGEFERWFQDFKSIGLDLNIFSMPFSVDCEQLKSSLQLELIQLQCSTQLKQQFLNTSKLEFYNILPKSSSPNFMSRPENHVHLCFLIFVQTSFFQYEASKKQC
jgi:hypothetical protein